MAIDKRITKAEESLERSDDYNDVPPSDVIAFNELRSCADLFRLYEDGQLVLQPDFQRDIVWQNSDQTRFIDSLTKQLPIPSMCISLDFSTNQRLVIDGLQRIRSIVEFLSDDEYTLSALNDIDQKISGKTVATIKSEHPEIYSRVQNLMIPITVIRCTYDKPAHMEYLYTIFYRLNSGGARLNNQEIRNCIYTGEFNTLLKELANLKVTTSLFGSSRRFAAEEYILRFFTFNERLSDYNGRLSKFLNNYMFAKRHADVKEIVKLKEKYEKAATLIDTKMINTRPLTKTLSKTAVEGLLFGVAQNLKYLESAHQSKLEKMFKKFLVLPEFSAEQLKEGLSAKKNVTDRLNAAKKCFAG